MQSERIDVGGVRTRVLSAGEGPPLLLIHGFGTTADVWAGVGDRLGRHRRVLAPDLVGQGATDAVDLAGGPPQPVLVEHLVALLDRLGVERAAVAGSSFGAQLAVLLALAVPERVERLVLVNSGSITATEPELAAALARTRAAGVAYFADPTPERTRRWFAGSFHDPAAVPEALVDAYLASVARPEVRRFYLEAVDGMADLERARPYRVQERLGELRVPVLAVWGGHDRMGTPERAAEVLASAPAARLVVFDDSAHLPFVEAPERFEAEVLRFLAED